MASFAESTSPDITESIPTQLSGRSLTEALQDFGLTADVTIGNLPFRLAISDQRPYRRQSAPVRKQQFDNSREAGEQTLDQWWIRSQTSWHRGAGINFYEPGLDPTTEYRFADSDGVDVSRQDQITLLPKQNPVVLAGGESGRELAYSGSNAYFYVLNRNPTGGDDLVVLFADGTVFRNKVAIFGSGSSSLTVDDEGNAYVVSNDSTSSTMAVFKYDFAADAASVLYTSTADTSALQAVWWAKDRLLGATGDGGMYELDRNVGAPTAVSTLTAAFERPSGYWGGLAEAPNGFYLWSGSSGEEGRRIYFVGLTASGTGLPTLSPPVEVGQLPVGEWLQQAAVYLGTYLILSTYKGVRVALIGSDGALSIGPIVGPTDIQSGTSKGITFTPVGALVAREDSDGGYLLHVDLGTELEQGSQSYAWFKHLRMPGRIRGVVTSDELTPRTLMADLLGNVYLTSTTEYQDTGSLTSGAIRFGTTEPKQFYYVRLRTKIDVDCGTVNLAIATRSGEAISIITVDSSSNSADDIRIGYPTTPQEYMSFRVTLTPGSAGAPIVESLAVKAMPLPSKRQRLIQVPLFCMDSEQDRYGNTTNGIGYPRLAALEGMEESQGVVQFRDSTCNEALNVIIEEVSFERQTPPNRNEGNFGGIVTVTLRSV